MAQSTLGYSLKATISLPGSNGGHGDWVAYDAPTNTVWLAQSPDNNVVVIDAATNTVKATIAGIGNANGIALTSQYAFVADVTRGTLDVIDKSTYAAVLPPIAVPGTTPDSVTYISSTNEIAVASDDANTEYFYNATTFALTATLQLTPNPAAAGPDVAIYVASKDLLYQPDDTQVDVIDPHTHAIVATRVLLTTGSVKPGVYDKVTNTFLFGTTNKQVLVVDGDTGAVKSTIAIPGSVDQAAIADGNPRLAYFADKSGTVDMINLDTDTLVGQLPATLNAHTLTVNPTDASVYLYEYNNTVSVYGIAPITTNTVSRFFDKATGTHFFTASATEAAALNTSRPDLVPEANSFSAIVPSSNDPTASPVMRFFDPSNGTHFFTTSATEQANLQASRTDLKFEGTAFYEDASLRVGDQAVYRFFDTQDGSHMFTASLAEVASLQGNAVYKAEGIAFYAPTKITASG